MKFELVRNLMGCETLGRTIYDGNDDILLLAGTKLTVGYVNRLKQKCIYSVYLESEELGGIKSDFNIALFKNQALDSIPEIFNKLSTFDKSGINEVGLLVDGLIQHIIAEGNANTNLFELKQYNDYTYIHCIDTCIMAIFLSIELGIHRDYLRSMALGAILHDIGKTRIPDAILNKTGRLTKEEFEIMKKHSEYGYCIVKDSGINNDIILQIILQHHERIDGMGYPNGLKRDKISSYAKIVSVCDVFTAISANRCYRSGFSPNEAYEYVMSGIGTIFDEQVVQKFRNTFSIYPLGCLVKLSNGVEGYIVSQNKGYPDRPVIKVIHDWNTGKTIPAYEINLLNYSNITIKQVIKLKGAMSL